MDLTSVALPHPEPEGPVVSRETEVVFQRRSLLTLPTEP